MRTGSSPGDLFVKHLIAGSSKSFFGYGPRGQFQTVLQGRLAVFASDLQGPGLMSALAADPFGRLCMRHINHLYVEATTGQLRRLAADQFGLSRLDVVSDIDFDAGLSVGLGIADRALPFAAPDALAPADLAADVTAALGSPAEVRLGPFLLVAWADPPAGLALPEGHDPEGTFTFLQAWDALRPRLAERLRAAAPPARGTFAALVGGRLVAGVLLTDPPVGQ